MNISFGALTPAGVWTVLTDLLAVLSTAFGWTGHLENDILTAGAALVTALHVHGLHVGSSGKAA